MKTISILTILFIGNILFMHSSCLPKTRLLNNKTVLTDTTKHKKVAKLKNWYKDTAYQVFNFGNFNFGEQVNGGKVLLQGLPENGDAHIRFCFVNHFIDSVLFTGYYHTSQDWYANANDYGSGNIVLGYLDTIQADFHYLGSRSRKGMRASSISFDFINVYTKKEITPILVITEQH